MSWQGWLDHGMESQFNPRVAVGDAAAVCLAAWADQSEVRKAELTGRFDLAYGPHHLMRYDFHPGHKDRPIIINFHGGYWRALDKADMNHHMADLAKSGFGLVNMNYPLCPDVSMTQMMTHLGTGIDEVIKMLDAGGHHQPIIMFGHSAGAHIALHLSHHPKLANRLAGIAALSGIYETELVLELAVNEDVRLSMDEAHKWNCLTHMPRVGPAYYIAVGGAEPSGWIDQSWIMSEALCQRGDRPQFHGCGGLHHFNLVDCLCDANHHDGARLHDWMKFLSRGL